MVIRFTANFEHNLQTIEAVWAEADSPQNYDRLLDELGEKAIPNLGRFPAMGWPSMARRP